METSPSGAGGKIVTDRRRQRNSASPYHRPPQLSPRKSSSWFSGVIVPSARAIASSAGKIFSAIFSESESSSSDEEDCASEDDIVDDNLPEIPCNQEIPLDEMLISKKNVSSSEVMMQCRQESQLSVWRSETKILIEELIMKETFSLEECDRLMKVLNSRVMDWSMDLGEKSSVTGSPGNRLDHENADTFDKALQKAKRWFQEKRAVPSSVTELPQGSSTLNLTMLEQVETGGGSPVDVARSYMKTIPWASPGRYIELKTPSKVSMKLCQEGTLYSAGPDSVSSSEHQRSFTSGAWDIQEELHRVRSSDSSHFTVAQIRMESERAGKEVFVMGERLVEPLAIMLYRPIEVLSDAECSVPKLIHTSSPDHAEEQHSGLHLCMVNSSPAPEATSIVARESANDLLSSDQISLSGNRELLSEAYMESASLVQYEEQQLVIALPSLRQKHDIASGNMKQQGRKATSNSRRRRGRGRRTTS